jgi:hypothetical protein
MTKKENTPPRVVHFIILFVAAEIATLAGL